MTDFGERRRVLPKTWQIISYEDYDDGWYQKGWRNGERFKDIGDGTFIDNATGLMWAKDANGKAGNNGNAAAWSAALTYAEALEFARHSDWRLPNALEFTSLLDYSLPDIDVHHIVDNGQYKYLWTSTTDATYTNDAFAWWWEWLMVYPQTKSVSYHFFCCRDA